MGDYTEPGEVTGGRAGRRLRRGKRGANRQPVPAGILSGQTSI